MVRFGSYLGCRENAASFVRDRASAETRRHSRAPSGFLLDSGPLAEFRRPWVVPCLLRRWLLRKDRWMAPLAAAHLRHAAVSFPRLLWQRRRAGGLAPSP